jgi:dGTP triphosphohydrolase
MAPCEPGSASRHLTRIDGGVVMGLSFGKRGGSGCVAGASPPARRRTSARRRPHCEAMEARRLLSTSSAPAEGYLSPGTGEVAKAQSMMSSVAGQAFQKYASELQRLEQSSDVTRAEFANLENDIEQLAADIDSSDEMSDTDAEDETQQFIMVQDAVDQAFVAGSYTKTGWNQLETEMADGLSDVSITTNLPQQTVDQMKVIARAAHVTAAESQQLTADQQALITALGSHADSDLGGTTPRDPVVVYYQGQVNQFVHKR